MNEQSNGQTGSYQAWKTRFVGGILNYFRAADGPGSPFFQVDGANRKVIVNDTGTLQVNGTDVRTAVRQIRAHIATATVNAGTTLLAAVAGYKYVMIDCTVIAIGGAASGLTAFVVNATQASSGVALISAAQANLTQSTVLRPGITGVTVLADGASFAPCDVNTAITVGKTGGSLATSTFIDVIFTYYLSQ